LHTISRANPPLPPPSQVVHPSRGPASFRPLPLPPPQFAGPYVQTAHHRGGESNPRRPAERNPAGESTYSAELKISAPVNVADSAKIRKAAKSWDVEKSAWFQGHGQDLGQEQEQFNAEPIYLPESLLQRGPYIWTPDERPPCESEDFHCNYTFEFV